ncbi:hypothetical protein M422DRAFT_242384 [Sphaerobolus stellatus SS14]|nr:hypothetical protein M422DRAFT_242384 [Sphaerobolus stellatus SS14]
MDNEPNAQMQVDLSTNPLSAIQAFKMDLSTEWVIESAPGFDISHTVTEAWPELVRYQDDYYRLLEDYNILKETVQSAKKKAEDCRATINELYEKLDARRATIKNLGNQVQSLEEQLQGIKGNSDELPNHEELILENKHLQQELDYYVGRARYALYGKDANWATHEDLAGLPTVPKEIPQVMPARPPAKLARPVGKINRNDSKVIHEAGIPAIGGSHLPPPPKRIIANPPASITGVLPKPLEGLHINVDDADIWYWLNLIKPKHCGAEAEVLLQSIFSAVGKWDQMIAGQWKRNDSPFLCSPTPARYKIHRNQKFGRNAFTYWLGCEAGVTPNLARDKLEPYFANEITLLKGGPMNQFWVHDDLLPLIQESPFYYPPSTEEPMDQDEPDPEPTLSQPMVGSSSLANRLDYGEGGSFTCPPADARELRACISYFDSFVPQGTVRESTAELTTELYADNLE